jgi:septal ring factor EnvC (AmiA/AmiB activator)
MKIWLPALLMCITNSVFAQAHRINREKIDSVKAAYINQHLHLSEEQSKKFWPLYKDYIDNKKTIRNSIKQLRETQGTGTASEDQIKASLKGILKLKKEELTLEETFQNKLLTFMSARQTADLSKIERDFLMLLRNRIHGKKERAR